MKLCIKYRINPSKEQEETLNELCFYATKLYNTDNYYRRWVWDECGVIPSWYDQKKLLKTNHWKNLLPSQTAQAIIKTLQNNYNSWFSLRKTDETANPPGFRKKGRLSPITFYQQFKMEGNELSLSMSRKYAKEKGIKKLVLKIEKWKKLNGIQKMCNIVHDGKHWMVHVVYEIPEVKLRDHPEVMSVDLGVINLATTADTQGKTYIHSGGQALAVQHYFNKEIAKAQSKSDKQGVRSSKKWTMSKKRTKQVNQILHTVTKRIVDIAKNNKVGTLVVGRLTNIRKDKHWRKKESQKLHSWGFAKLTQQLKYKCALAGIRFKLVSEKDTSKTCSNCGIVKRSNRKHRGLYKCKCGNKLNADVNGALNILKKYLQGAHNAPKSIGDVALPVVYRDYNVVPI